MLLLKCERKYHLLKGRCLKNVNNVITLKKLVKIALNDQTQTAYNCVGLILARAFKTVTIHFITCVVLTKYEY